MTIIQLPAWTATLDHTQRAELAADLTADERCVCGSRDDQHDADGVCEASDCFAYNPIQQ